MAQQQLRGCIHIAPGLSCALSEHDGNECALPSVSDISRCYISWFALTWPGCGRAHRPHPELIMKIIGRGLEKVPSWELMDRRYSGLSAKLLTLLQNFRDKMKQKENILWDPCSLKTLLTQLKYWSSYMSWGCNISHRASVWCQSNCNIKYTLPSVTSPVVPVS